MRLMFRLIVALLLLAAPARAAEEILAFDQTLALAADGELVVTEAITVRAEGRDIRRGIFRDFPLHFEDRDGRRQEVGFSFDGATLDGAPVPARQEGTRTGTRLYLGDPDGRLEPGVHTYRLSYRTSRQIRFFEDHDELYWNVTGNEWAFPIREASASVALPGGSAALAGEPERLAAYTGFLGERGADVSIRETADGATFRITRGLQPGEGLSIVLGLRKGVVAPPSAAEELWYGWRAEILAAMALLLSAGYFVLAWNRVGRDPEKGVVIPLFHPPRGVSPALAHFIANNSGFPDGGWQALSATSVDLAVKGYLTFEDIGGSLRLSPTGKVPGADLSGGEREVARWFAGAGRDLTLSKADGESVKDIGLAHRLAIEKENRGRFYLRNGGQSAVGVLISAILGLGFVIFGGFSEDDFVAIPVILFAAVWLGAAAGGIGALLGAVGVKVGRGYAALAALAIGLAGLAAVEGFAAMTGLEADLLLPGTILALVAINILFLDLMGAPTREGRALMDRIEGLKLYLSVAEADRMNMAGAPQMSPTRYETLLPYAIALGVEKPWTEAFNTWLAAATAATAAYAPAWWHGDRFSGASGFPRSLSDDLSGMARSFASSVPTPKSSSSGFSSGSGGGGSGGGGGGGGGGGW